ncbi:MAG: hypothetical protein WCR96_02335 [Candidatus Methanomethylophilaceae archaeon]
MVIQKMSGKKQSRVAHKQSWDSVKKDIDIAYRNWLKKQILPKG